MVTVVRAVLKSDYQDMVVPVDCFRQVWFESAFVIGLIQTAIMRHTNDGTQARCAQTGGNDYHSIMFQNIY